MILPNPFETRHFFNISTYNVMKIENHRTQNWIFIQSYKMIYKCLNPVRSVHVDENDSDLLIILVKACQRCKECNPDRVVTLIENN